MCSHPRVLSLCFVIVWSFKPEMICWWVFKEPQAQSSVLFLNSRCSNSLSLFAWEVYTGFWNCHVFPFSADIPEAIVVFSSVVSHILLPQYIPCIRFRILPNYWEESCYPHSFPMLLWALDFIFTPVSLIDPSDSPAQTVLLLHHNAHGSTSWMFYSLFLSRFCSLGVFLPFNSGGL